MTRKIFKRLFFTLLALGVLGIGGWLVARQVIIVRMEHKALAIAQSALKDKRSATPDEKIAAITAKIFQDFYHQDPAQIPLLRLRPYLTNHRLPAFIRLPDGLIETFLEKGFCDNAARMLSFVLAQEGFESIQWDMVSPYTAHAALLVTMPDGRKVFADPFYGYVTADAGGHLVSPKQAQALLKAGGDFSSVFLPLGDNSDPRFYREFQNVRMAAQGDPLVLETELPLLNGVPLTLGKIDGSDIDVIVIPNKNRTFL